MSNKVSVVLPVYNGSKYVSNSIESVINQTYSNWELIIVDDCSTDNTYDIIKRYSDRESRITVSRNDVNQKLPATLNKGFALASGTYYTWTSDDNKYHPNALEQMVNILDTMNDIELVYADFSMVDMAGKLLKEIKEASPDAIRFGNIIGACFLYRSSLAKSVGMYNTTTFLAEDYDFFIRCHKMSNGRFYHLSEDLYDYGMHEANLTSTREMEIDSKTFDVMMSHYDYLYSLCKTNSDRNKFLRRLLFLLRGDERLSKFRFDCYRSNPLFAVSEVYHKLIAP